MISGPSSLPRGVHHPELAVVILQLFSGTYYAPGRESWVLGLACLTGLAVEPATTPSLSADGSFL